MKEAGKKINTFEDWKREMLELAQKAVSDKRLMNAAFSYRAANWTAFFVGFLTERTDGISDTSYARRMTHNTAE